LQEAARRVAQIFDVKYIVMATATADGGARRERHPLLQPRLLDARRSSDGFPHVAVTSGSAELRRWKGHLWSSSRTATGSCRHRAVRHKIGHDREGTHKPGLLEAAAALREVHRALVQAVRKTYEREVAAGGPGQMLRLLTETPISPGSTR